MKNNLKLIREQKQLSQKKVSEIVGVSERVYQNYEYGQTAPNVYTAMKISDVLDTPIRKIFIAE